MNYQVIEIIVIISIIAVMIFALRAIDKSYEDGMRKYEEELKDLKINRDLDLDDLEDQIDNIEGFENDR